MNILRIPVHYLLFIALAMLSCSMTPLTGGSDLPNGIRITGTVCDSNGAGSPQTEVRIIPADYDPVSDPPLPKNFTTMTDARGSYTLRAPEAGAYNIMAIQGGSKTRALLHAIAVYGDVVAAPQATLQEPGSIKVAVSSGESGTTGYWYIPGTTVSSFIDTNGFAVLDSVPAGVTGSVCYRDKSGPAAPVKIADGIAVPSGGTFTVAYAGWKFSKRLILNTGVSGADVRGDATGFPVLIRLNSSNFSFNEARPDGADLRFTKSNGTPLAFEIERWDSVVGRAEIWVNADTVYGNNEDQSITMCWGADFASSSLSNGQAVFDTTDGFLGVWHLDGNGDILHNATSHGFNGANAGSAPAAGIIGGSRLFAYGDYIKVSGLLGAPSAITLSAWVRTDTAKGAQEVISIGDAALIRLDDVLKMGTSGCYHDTDLVSDSNYTKVNSGRYLAKTGWHHVAFSINPTTQTQALYIDGAPSAISHNVNSINYGRLGTDTYFGRHGNGKTGFMFVGQMDEVRVNNVAVTADWIKLCFMNQKAQDELIVW